MHDLLSDIALLMVVPASEQVSLADAKARLSEVVEGIETEHRRVVITKHGRPTVVVLAVEDLEALEDTLDMLSDPDAMADPRRIGRLLERELEGWYSARVGAYRVIYWIGEDELIVYVDRVNYRSDVYRPK
ncbi:MAG: type II toxin-antitoxin system prevent-host-death family antitoxin [Actinobacteria bacterium]|nr:type II toxin-antitoxin system prevent-host-death family antitoxin [Actinomycetota bacterium]MCL5444596.1 type II toxin-antitoxin system prevent-host-death family antitoxin [Actinomycetota bacterium]